MKYIVLLKDMTVGNVDSEEEVKIGDTVTVSLQDENGNYIKTTGIIEDILDEKL